MTPVNQNIQLNVYEKFQITKGYFHLIEKGECSFASIIAKISLVAFPAIALITVLFDLCMMICRNMCGRVTVAANPPIQNVASNQPPPVTTPVKQSGTPKLPSFNSRKHVGRVAPPISTQIGLTRDPDPSKLSLFNTAMKDGWFNFTPPNLVGLRRDTEALTLKIPPELADVFSGRELIQFIKNRVKTTLQPIHILKSGKNPAYHITANHVWEKTKGDTRHYPKGSFKTKKAATNEVDQEVARLVCHNQNERDGIYREYSFLKELVGKRGIVQAHDLVESRNKNGTWTLTIYEDNYVWGDLDVYLAAGNILPEDQLDKLATDLIYGVHAAHEKQIAICDIKPNNVVLGDEGNGVFKAGLIDFNLAVHLDRQRHIGRSGSAKYTPPEKATMFGEWSTQNELSADVFSLGITLYYLYEKKYPGWFKKKDGREVLDEIGKFHGCDGSFFREPNRAKKPRLHLIWQMCQFKPELRPTMNQLLASWEAISPSNLNSMS